MTNSVNGYPVLTSRTTGKTPRLRKWKIPGTERHLLLRDGSTGFLLIHMATWFDQVIEPLDRERTWDDWGWAARPVRGGSKPSNHASGTAMDLNATQHPMGVATGRTFSVKEINEIHKREAFYSGCVLWGGDWTRRPDAMHFEIGRGMGPCEAKARKLLTSPRGKSILNVNPGAKAVILS
jgi:D-alanyl-D-alanine carboxypeptidase